MNKKIFSQRFNREIMLLDFPEEFEKKIKAVKKFFGINHYLATSMLFGHVAPTGEQLERIAAALDVCPLWLSGVNDKKAQYSRKVTTED